MTNIVKYAGLGWYHPSNANWCYRVHIIIDNTGARLYRETFGGDCYMRGNLTAKGFTVERLSVGLGGSVEYKWRDIKDLKDIESYTGKNWGDND